MMRLNQSVAALSILFVLGFVGIGPALAQAPENDTRASARVEPQTDAEAALVEREREYERRLTAMEVTVANLQTGATTGIWVITVLGIFLGLGPLFWQSITQRGARRLQDNFLTSSAQTIDLVNTTLTLANEASSRAADALRKKAKREGDALDMNAKDLLMRAGGDDPRAIVANSAYRTELESLAERIRSFFDIHNAISDDKPPLSAHCYFVLGLFAHLKNHFPEAFERWSGVAFNDEADKDLRSRAYYWIGYERNNLGQFPQARQSYHAARELAEPPRTFELERYSIEADFFDRAPTKQCVEKMRTLLNTVEGMPADQTLERIRNQIRVTAGNILYVQGRELRESGAPSAAVSEAFTQARLLLKSVSNPDKWSLLGYAQCCLELNEDVDAARELLASRVFPAAQKEFETRVEKRTKALAQFTQLICCLANSHDPEMYKMIETIKGQISAEVGDVDNRLTFYSLLQRRNVSKEQFRADVEAVYDAGVAAKAG